VQAQEESMGAGLASPMLEGALALSVVRYCLAVAMQFVLIGEQAFKSNWPTSMKLAVADSQLSAQAIAETIGKAG
jgi:hypothetical protein